MDHGYAFLVESYGTEFLKTLSVWREFTDADLDPTLQRIDDPHQRLGLADADVQPMVRPIDAQTIGDGGAAVGILRLQVRQ